jgi:hypothetical protein
MKIFSPGDENMCSLKGNKFHECYDPTRDVIYFIFMYNPFDIENYLFIMYVFLSSGQQGKYGNRCKGIQIFMFSSDTIIRK